MHKRKLKSECILQELEGNVLGRTGLKNMVSWAYGPRTSSWGSEWQVEDEDLEELPSAGFWFLFKLWGSVLGKIQASFNF